MKNYNKNYFFDISKIVEYLKPYKMNLSKMYPWKSPNDTQIKKAYKIGLISELSKTKLIDTDSYFERNVLMKHLISKELKRNNNILEAAANWIIRDWGGIRANDKNGLLKLVNSFLESLNKEENIEFDRIASLSKVASFMHPEKYIIYDSRVAYSLNWIMLKMGASEQFFPMPLSRNSKLTSFDVDVLIKLKNKQHYVIQSVSEIDRRFISKRDKQIYIPKNRAYLTLCDVVSDVNREMWKDNSDLCNFPFHTEMLLFSIADREIIKDIIDSVEIKIKCQ